MGNDTLTVTDSILAIPIAGFSLGSSAICLGNSISVTDNSTGKSLSYEYILLDKSGTHLDSSFSQNPSFTYGKAGKFRILQMIASGTGCTDTFSASFEIDTVNANFIHGAPKADKSIQFTASDLSLKSYKWNFGDAGSDSVSSPLHKYAAYGWYHVTLDVTNSIGCTASIMDSVDILFTGIDEANENSSSLQLFPNPASDNVYLFSNVNAIQKVNVLDAEGRIVISSLNGLLNNNKMVLNTSALPSGIYLFQIISDREIQTRKVLIQR